MKRKILIGGGIIIVIGVLLLISIQFVNQNTTIFWNTYLDSKTGITFNYPPGWEVVTYQREQPSKDRNIRDSGIFYPHFWIREKLDPNIGEYLRSMELYTNEEILNPYYNFDGYDKPIDDRGVWDEFDNIQMPVDKKTYPTRVMASFAFHNWRGLYRDNDTRVGLKQFNCYATSAKTQQDDIRECRRIFTNVFESIEIKNI